MMRMLSEKPVAAPRKAFLLRLDVHVYEEIRRLAASELRSVNGQIEYMIRQTLRDRGRTSEEGRTAGTSDVGDDGPTAPERERGEAPGGG